MIKEIYTANYGVVTIKDVMVDIDGTNLEGGINIHDEDGNLLCEVAGVSCDDVIDDFDVENYIEKPLYEDPEDYDF